MSHGKLCPIVNKQVDLGCACVPFVPDGRCHVTGNACGTDTWMVGYTCPCPGCVKYLASQRSGHSVPNDQEKENG